MFALLSKNKNKHDPNTCACHNCAAMSGCRFVIIAKRVGHVFDFNTRSRSEVYVRTWNSKPCPEAQKHQIVTRIWVELKFSLGQVSSQRSLGIERT
jgi:hypothetical protein